MIPVEPHPLLLATAFETHYPARLAEQQSPSWLLELLSTSARGPLGRSDAIRSTVRDVFRHGGYKPTGRGKPASEYLVKAASQGRLASINVAVDLCNAVSLHSGLPISTVDLDLLQPPLRIAIARDDQSYPFNHAGQQIRLGGLICLRDAQGPCANGVKDSQRTKTGDDTVRTLSIVWGARELADHTARTVTWYRELCQRQGASTSTVQTEKT